MAAARGIERRDPDQAVDPVFTAQIAVGIGACNPEGHRLDAGLLPVQKVQDLHVEFMALSPAGVHAKEETRPILGLGPSGTRMQGDDGIHGIVLAREEGLQAQAVIRALPVPDRLLGFFQHARIVLFRGQVQHDPDVLVLGQEIFEALPFLIEEGDPFLDALGPAGVSPKVRLQGFLGQFFLLFFIGFQAERIAKFMELYLMACRKGL